MTDPNQIPYLINLLDDDSLDIQENVALELASYGPALRHEIKKLDVFLNTTQYNIIQKILKSHQRTNILQTWSSWFQMKNPYDRLEAALSILAEFLNDPTNDVTLKTLLDDLAHSFYIKYQSDDPIALAQYLFKELKITGNEEDYYNPQNSNLVRVIKEKRGIPISLVSIYMLVGARLGMKIEGCHFPGHFLSRINVDAETLFVDCFTSGNVIHESDILRVRDDLLEGVEHILKEKAEPETMVRRFLANLIRAYQMQENVEGSEKIVDLLKQLDLCLVDHKISELTPADIISEPLPLYNSGKVVRHKRYGYRGIIVDSDQICQATDSWYYGNQTQPSREQPWYHVLVDGSDQVTYVAESNLVCDENEHKIEHPLLSYFFKVSIDGRYIRNSNDWPDTDL